MKLEEINQMISMVVNVLKLLDDDKKKLLIDYLCSQDPLWEDLLL